MNKIRKGDEVIVIAGRDKGKRGAVIAVIDDGLQLMVDGINTVKKHKKADPSKDDRGGIIIKTKAIDASNVMLYDTSTQKGSRVGIRTLADGSKVRYFKSTNEVVDVGV